MCGILAILDLQTEPAALRRQALELSRRQRHRGPDWSGIFAGDGAILAHERLAIVDPTSGGQPLYSADGKLVLAVNGEIYNHRSLRAELAGSYDFQTGSDCEVILALYRRYGTEFLNRLNGIFAFVLYDRERRRYLIARDPIGVMPLFTGRDRDGNLYAASEMKALADVCRTLEDFPPGHVLDGERGAPEPYYRPAWRDYRTTRGVAPDLERLRGALDAAVARQLMSDVPYGVLLSGGLASSLIAALAARHSRRRIETDDRDEAWWPRLHSFAIGLEGSPDLAAARLAAEALGTVHHELHFTIQEGLDALADVIYHIESFDVTTVRASTPMYLMARRIKAMGIKMVLSGEGSDEIFGGYLYFHKAPSAEEFHAETVRKLDMLHKYDCLRANKSMAAWGVEARVPFLDRDFLDVAMGFDAEHKMVREGKIEKHVLRQAFAGYLPDAVLWRQKEQFSDGVGYGWIDALRDHAEERISDGELARARFRFPDKTPLTKEAFLYRALFEERFTNPAAVACVEYVPSIACSTPTALAWDASFAAGADPSGRAVEGVHKNSYGSG
ncbi:MAG: asparagine synthase B [Acidobacteria bacterium]|nr:MAG: asparagine synthase B [Acidobacteriota bacterium]